MLMISPERVIDFRLEQVRFVTVLVLTEIAIKYTLLKTSTAKSSRFLQNAR